MAAVMLQVIHIFWKNYSKNTLFVPANTYKNYFVSKYYCNAHHDDKMCLLPNFRYQVILLWDFKKWPRSLDVFCFNYQEVDCLNTFFGYGFSGKRDVKSGQVFDNMHRAVRFSHQKRGVNRMPKRPLRKNYHKTFVEVHPKNWIDAN